MVRFPLCAITEAIQTGVLEENMLDAVQEILNISAQIFNEKGHQVLQQVCITPKDLPADAAEVLRWPAGRMDMSVEVSGYGDGRMTILIGGPNA